MVMISIFDYNIKGFIYIFGLFLAYGITIPLQNTLNTKLYLMPDESENGNIKTVDSSLTKLQQKINPLWYLISTCRVKALDVT